MATHPGLAQRLAGLFGRSAAMGLLRGPTITDLNPASIRRLVADLQHHGIATAASVGLAPLLRDGPPQWDEAMTRTLEQRLDQVAQAIEASPAPAAEWPAMREVFGDEALAELLAISASSLRRYGAGERDTPGLIVARLHWLAMIVSDLAGGYNRFGIRRWFDRPRAQLQGQSPRAVLGPDWSPDNDAASRLRALAAPLNGAQALAI